MSRIKSRINLWAVGLSVGFALGAPGVGLVAAASGAEGVSPPQAPAGIGTLRTWQSSYFRAGGASCDDGTAVEYQFDWGDGEFSSWQAPLGRTAGAAPWAALVPSKTSTPADLLADIESLRPLVRGRGRLRVIASLSVRIEPGTSLAPRDLSLRESRIAETQAQLIAGLGGTGVRELRRFRIVPGLALSVDEEGLEELGRSALVSRLREDVRLSPSLHESVPLIGAPAAWDAGYTGDGQVVAILDDGVASAHPALQGKVVGEACFSSNDPYDLDDYSESRCPRGFGEFAGPGSAVPFDAHGSHIAAIAAGHGGGISGVAPGASILALRVFSSVPYGRGSYAFTSDAIAALEFVHSLRDALPIAAVNLSLNKDMLLPYAWSDWVEDPLTQVIAELRAAGIATIASAGNRGDIDGVDYPAERSGVIAVGSTTRGDLVSIFSDVNYGDSFLVAPGEGILSADANAGLVAMSGTSMAAAHVAGAWALLRSKNPSATVDQVLEALSSTAVAVDHQVYAYGHTFPRIQVDRALEALEPGTGPTAGGEVLALHRWAKGGTYSLRARARCAAAPDLVSGWSKVLTVAIQERESVSTPELTGPTSGRALDPVSFKLHAGVSTEGNPIQHSIEWGDGTSSRLRPGEDTAVHSWRRPGEYDVRVQGRALSSDVVVSEWSSPLRISIEAGRAPDLTGDWRKLTVHCKKGRNSDVCTVKGRLIARNLGDKGSRIVHGGVLFSTDSIPSSDDRLAPLFRVKEVPAGSARPSAISFELDRTAIENHPYVIAILDYFDNLLEKDETNNRLPAQVWQLIED